MARFAIVFALVLAACSAPTSASPAAATPRVFVPTGEAQKIEGGCGTTTVLLGGLPQALIDATGNNPPGLPIPYAVARPPVAAGFIFNYPLLAGRSPKILWVVATARTGDLTIDGHPLGQSGPTIRVSRPPDSGPGEIYPSNIDVPVAGCWQFTLRWSDRVAEIALEYR